MLRIGARRAAVFAAKPLAQQVAALFRSGEQGAWYDPSDMSTMFQDAAGTLPVYAPGQGQVDPPVGLWLDKRPGLVRGPELLMNGDFAAGNASWGVARADATHVVDFTGGACRYKSDTTSPALTVSQGSLSIVAGRWYELTIVVSNWVSGSVKTDSFNGTAPSGLMLASSAGTFRVIGLATASTSVFSFLRNSANVDLTIDSISIRELPGNHAYQATTTSRPTLSARYNQLLASEKFDDPYWTWQASFTSQKTSEITDPSGGFDGWKITSKIANAALSRAGLTGFRNPVFTMVAKAGTWTPSIMVRNATTAVNLINAPLTSGDFTNSYGKYSAKDLGGGWKEMKIEITSGVAVTDLLIAYIGSTGAIPVGQYMYLLRADFRESGDGVGIPAYQRIVDANTYDTVGFPLYLKFDGVDDFLQTASVDFSGTDKVTIAAALRKLTDVSVGMLAELGPDVTTTAGTFGLYSRNSGIADGIMWRSRGTSIASAAPAGLLAPVSLVAVGSSDLSTGRHELRVNGASAALSSTAQGGGTYGGYPLYIGRRGGTSLPFNGRLYSLLIRGAATPDTTIAKVESYLNQKARIY